MELWCSSSLSLAPPPQAQFPHQDRVDMLAGSGEAPLDVQQFLDQGASDDMEGGSVSQVLDKLAKGSALAGAATAATGVGAAATPFLEGAAGVAKVGSEIADLFGYGDMDVRQYME